MKRQSQPDHSKLWKGNALLILLASIALARAAQIAWLSDDSFLSMRYAENFALGNGLVFNPGEHVEGYTNFLWTIILAALYACGISMVTAATYLGLLFYTLLAITLAYSASTYHKKAGFHYIPVASAFALISDDFHQWASGGLETLMFSCFSLIGMMLTRKDEHTASSVLAMGIVFSLLVLTRMDGVLIVMAGAFSLLMPNKAGTLSDRLLTATLAMLPVMTTLAAWLLFKWHYYHDFFPTAFYSKMATQQYFSQGVLYLALFLKKNWSIPAFILVSIIFTTTQKRNRNSDKDIAAYLIAFTVYGMYTIYTGGDFMFARKWILILPLLLLAFQVFMGSISSAKTSIITSLLFLACSAFPTSIYKDGNVVIHYIANEKEFYTARNNDQRKLQADETSRVFSNSHAKLVIDGGLLMLAYHSKLPYFVETTGLTQYEIAKQAVTQRGYIGHEKLAAPEWLEANNVNIRITNKWPDSIDYSEPQAVNELLIVGKTKVSALIIRYDENEMNRLKSVPGVYFMDIDDLIEQTKVELGSSDEQTKQALLRNLYQYFFKHASVARKKEWQELVSISNINFKE